jgi:hypothetical protein
MWKKLVAFCSTNFFRIDHNSPVFCFTVLLLWHPIWKINLSTLYFIFSFFLTYLLVLSVFLLSFPCLYLFFYVISFLLDWHFSPSRLLGLTKSSAWTAQIVRYSTICSAFNILFVKRFTHTVMSQADCSKLTVCLVFWIFCEHNTDILLLFSELDFIIHKQRFVRNATDGSSL